MPIIEVGMSSIKSWFSTFFKTYRVGWGISINEVVGDLRKRSISGDAWTNRYC